jgi:hypothetical protein
MFRLFVFLSLVCFPSQALAWDYVPHNGDPMGSLAGGTLGTLYKEHPNEASNVFVPEGSGDEELFFDDDENHSFGGVLVKAQNTRGGCTWYEYQGAAKFGKEYFLGLPKSIHDGDCNKP